MSKQTEGRQRAPHYTLHPVTKPIANAANKNGGVRAPASTDPFARPANEDDDGYDPFSDRPPAPEPTYQEDPWR